MAKEMRTKRVRVLALIVGIVFACGGVYFLINGIFSYANQFKQEAWPVATATVINVDKYRSGHKGRSKRYDIIYQYETDSDIFTGTVYRSNFAKNIGDTLEVKYNPDAPNESTVSTEPTLGFLISGILAFIIFGFIGFRLIRGAFGRSIWIGIPALFKKQLRLTENRRADK